MISDEKNRYLTLTLQHNVYLKHFAKKVVSRKKKIVEKNFFFLIFGQNHNNLWANQNVSEKFGRNVQNK